MAVACRHWHGLVRAGNGDVSNAALPVAEIGAKRQVMGPITGAIVAVGDLVDNRQHVSDNDDNGDNYNYIEEVIHSENDDLEFPAVTGRLERPVNRR